METVMFLLLLINLTTEYVGEQCQICNMVVVHLFVYASFDSWSSML